MRQVPATIKRLIGEWRVREHDCCGQTIAYFLERESQVRHSGPMSYEILAVTYMIRSKWRKNQTQGVVPTAACARAVIPMDTVAVGPLFAFMGVDMDTKAAEVVRRPILISDEGAALLRTAMARRVTGRGKVLQPDGGPECKGACAQQARSSCDRQRIARPYKKNEQADSESFTRTLRKEGLSGGTDRTAALARLIPEGEAFLARDQYHRPHVGLSPMRSPLQTPTTQEKGLSDITGE